MRGFHRRPNSAATVHLPIARNDVLSAVCDMTVDFKKLTSFVKIVDAGSMSRAAHALNIAQPALSQHIAALEAHFKQTLLLRSNHGIAPTEAGLTLYRHAQVLLKQLDQAERDVANATKSLQGRVSVGLATFSAATLLAAPLLLSLAEKHPDIVLNVSDSFGNVLSDLVVSGRLDMALIYSFGPIKGVRLEPLFEEEVLLVAPRSMKLPGQGDQPLGISALQGIRLLLPGRYHFLRRLVEASFAHARITPLVAGEIESIVTLTAALEAGIGATLVPKSTARTLGRSKNTVVRRLHRPTVAASISLCQSDHMPLSQAALVVRELILRKLSDLAEEKLWQPIRAATV
jgi:LysR family transcriptional regulator, nitrogen assimilation regulatory protein